MNVPRAQSLIFLAALLVVGVGLLALGYYSILRAFLYRPPNPVSALHRACECLGDADLESSGLPNELPPTAEPIRDAWGNPVAYRRASPTVARIVSYGEDGQAGGSGLAADWIAHVRLDSSGALHCGVLVDTMH